MNNVAPLKFGMGAPVRRKEDKALVTGAGHFTDDYTPEGTLRAYVLRSTMAHARIKRRRPRCGAQAMPGVRLILTGADVARRRTGCPARARSGRSTAPTRRCPPHPLLVGDVVRHVGDPIAFIVADDLEQAQGGGRGDRGRLRAARRSSST